MLSTHYKKDAQLIAATIDNTTEKVKKRIYFLSPDDCSSESSNSESEEDNEEYFRIPMAKKPKVEKRTRQNINANQMNMSCPITTQKKE